MDNNSECHTLNGSVQINREQPTVMSSTAMDAPPSRRVHFKYNIRRREVPHKDCRAANRADGARSPRHLIGRARAPGRARPSRGPRGLREWYCRDAASPVDGEQTTSKAQPTVAACLVDSRGRLTFSSTTLCDGQRFLRSSIHLATASGESSAILVPSIRALQMKTPKC